MKRLRRGGAVLLAALAGAVLAGCASLGAPASAPADTPSASASAASAAASAPSAFELVPPAGFEQQSPTLGVQVEIDAPGSLKALLERHLDLVRLGRIERSEVEDSEWARLTDAAPAQVRELLQTEGYFAPQVSVERTPGRGAGLADRVRLVVVPGQRVRVKRLTLEAQGPLERTAAEGDAYARGVLDAWRADWPMAEGEEFRNADWSEAKASALARLRAAGYATASWVGTGAQVDGQAGTVRLFLVVDSGPLFRYGQLDIEGLVVHDRDTVMHLANVPPGAPVTETLLLDFQDRLHKSGLFESVSVTLDPDAARADSSRVIARLREASLQVYTLGVGASANTGPRASVEHTYRRVFGFAAASRNKIEWGSKRQFWEGEISTHPGRGLYRNLLGGTVENLESDSDVVLSQRARLGRTQDGRRIERLYFVEAERSRRTTVAGDRGNAFALSLNYHGVWRELDSVVLPTEGFTFAAQVGAGRSRGTDARSGTFERAYARFTGYMPLGRAWYGQARLEAGQVFLDTGMVVPDSQKFRAGGDDSVRGYGFRTLGPIVDGAVGSGKSMYTASIELARPISANLPSVWGAVFVDAGNAADSFAQLEPAVGLGVGVRWRSPVGPLRVDWAWGRETRKSRLHFSIGIAF
ncbi:MAG: outer membrane protein assembly factor [Leptothrix sp. (in: Bacteria)]|nr:outer membrane protein assembly factor [Leptothrix sp. (in: b-proteobacteria)]